MRGMGGGRLYRMTEVSGNEEEPKTIELKQFLRLLKYLGPHKWTVIVSLTISLISTFIMCCVTGNNTVSPLDTVF